MSVTLRKSAWLRTRATGRRRGGRRPRSVRSTWRCLVIVPDPSRCPRMAPKARIANENATSWELLLGLTGDERAALWAAMLTELRNRGQADALIVCCDGLRCLPKSIQATWPQTSCRALGAHQPPLRVGSHLPGIIPGLGERLGGVHPVPGVPRRVVPGRRHGQRRGEPQRPVSKSRAAPRPLTATSRPR